MFGQIVKLFLVLYVCMYDIMYVCMYVCQCLWVMRKLFGIMLKFCLIRENIFLLLLRTNLL